MTSLLSTLFPFLAISVPIFLVWWALQIIGMVEEIKRSVVSVAKSQERISQMITRYVRAKVKK